MTTLVNENLHWTTQQLTAFASANDMQISPFYSDGKTYGTPLWIWSVTANSALYVRAWHGTHSSWYRSAVEQGAGRMHLAGRNYHILFKPVMDPNIIQTVNMAYQAKYKNSPYLAGMVNVAAQRSTLCVLPRDKDRRKE